VTWPARRCGTTTAARAPRTTKTANISPTIKLDRYIVLHLDRLPRNAPPARRAAGISAFFAKNLPPAPIRPSPLGIDRPRDSTLHPVCPASQRGYESFACRRPCGSCVARPAAFRAGNPAKSDRAFRRSPGSGERIPTRSRFACRANVRAILSPLRALAVPCGERMPPRIFRPRYFEFLLRPHNFLLTKVQDRLTLTL
jgi:hypothetical protein